MSELVYKIWSKIWKTTNQLWGIRNVRKKLLALPVCILLFAFMYLWTLQTNSFALNAFGGLIFFDLITLVGDLVGQFYTQTGKPATSLSFGYVRMEVLIHFAILCAGLIISVWTLIFGIDLILTGANQLIHVSRFIPILILGTGIHFFVCLESNPFVMMSKYSPSCTYLQKCYQRLCTSFGVSLSHSSALAFPHNPLAILGLFSSGIIVMLSFLLPNGNSRLLDFLGGSLILFSVVSTLWPLSCYTGQILLQTVPVHTLAQLEKTLREALTIDGVLEFRNEMFWTLSYGQVAGSLHVRVRRDASEQMVLMQVYEKLVPLAPHLTIQITKDDVGRRIGGIHQNQNINIREGGIMSTPLVTTVVDFGNSPEISPILQSVPRTHVIYSTASGSSTSSNQPKLNVSTSTKIYENNETAVNIGDLSVLSSASSSVFPVDILATPALTLKDGRTNIQNNGNFKVPIPRSGFAISNYNYNMP